jgi:hypothetical protein
MPEVLFKTFQKYFGIATTYILPLIRMLPRVSQSKIQHSLTIQKDTPA